MSEKRSRDRVRFGSRLNNSRWRTFCEFNARQALCSATPRAAWPAGSSTVEQTSQTQKVKTFNIETVNNADSSVCTWTPQERQRRTRSHLRIFRLCSTNKRKNNRDREGEGLVLWSQSITSHPHFSSVSSVSSPLSLSLDIATLVRAATVVDRILP